MWWEPISLFVLQVAEVKQKLATAEKNLETIRAEKSSDEVEKLKHKLQVKHPAPMATDEELLSLRVTCTSPL